MSRLLKGVPGTPALQGDLAITAADEVTEVWKVDSTGKMTSSSEAGAKNGSTVTVEEKGSGVVHQTVLTLASTLCPIVSVTTGNGVGGIKIYDMPEGYIRVLGCTADLTLLVGSAKEADYTDNTPEGDMGIGTVAPANADAFGTDATDDDIATGATITMSTFADTVTLTPEAALNHDGTSTAKDVFVNMLIDAADIDDDTTSEVEVSGTVTLTWINLGDF